MRHACDRADVPGPTLRVIPARRFWMECTGLDCRSRGPSLPTPEDAALAYAQTASTRTL